MTPRQRINGFHFWSLLGLAVITDVFQFLLTLVPFVGPFLASLFAVIARIIFWVWFKVLHVGFADKSNRYVVNVTMSLVEFVPLINFAPAWTIGTWFILKQVKEEDKEFNEELQKKSQ